MMMMILMMFYTILSLKPIQCVSLNFLIPSLHFLTWKPSAFLSGGEGGGDDDNVGLHVLGCRVDILGTNCNKLLKLKMSGAGGGGVASASVRVIMSGGQQGAYCSMKKTFCRWKCILLRIKNDDHLLTAVNGPVMRAASF